MTRNRDIRQDGLPIRRWTPFVMAAATLLAAVSAPAQEWTRFRGPNGTGHSRATALPIRWSAADYQWNVKLPGEGHSSPVVWGDRLFLMSADPDTARRYLLCLDTANGTTVWQRTYLSAPHHLHLRNTFASSSPAVDAQRVYVAFAAPGQLTLKALSHEGEPRWSQDLGPFLSQHGFGTSPIVFEDLVILFASQQAEQLRPGQQPGQSYVMAFDRRTGQLRWKTPRTTTRVCYGTPCIYQPPAGPPELIGYNTGDGIFSLDARTGQPKWNLEVFRMRCVNSPILVGELVFGSNGSGGGGNFLVAVRGGPQPELVYELKRGAPYVPTPIARGNLVFLFSDKGFASCLEADSGNVLWRERLDTAFSGSPVLVGDRLYCIDEEGTVIVLAAAREFQELARNPLGEPSRSTPAISGGRMFLRTISHLFCLAEN